MNQRELFSIGLLTQNLFTACFVLNIAQISTAQTAFAQIVPDNLGAESSLVTPNVSIQGSNADRIDGGATRGSNLFHSFSQFNINDNQRIYFNNPSGVTNILTRVTGGNPSSILGTLGVDGNANLFLINPSGIVFGENASLDVNGSFIGSTADSINFADGSVFSAKSGNNQPLLTISVPIGLQLGTNPGNITVEGRGHNLTYDPSTFATIRGDVPFLKVKPGKTLALIGGDITLNGGNIQAESGRVELGSVSQPGLVRFTENDSGFTFEYSGIENFGNIQLSQKSSVDTSGDVGGSIQIQGRRLSLQDGSSILSITSGNVNSGNITSGNINSESISGGDFIVNVTESVELIGESPNGSYASSLLTESQGSGNSGNLTLNTGSLTTTDGAYLSTFITSSGNGGNLKIKATNSVNLLGRGLFESGLYTGTSTGSSGNAGKLTIETGNLTLQNGATIFGSSPGLGNAGDILIKANNGVFISDSRVISSARNSSSGSIEINTGTLQVNNGIFSNIISGKSDAGNVVITARDEVSLSRGSGIYSSTLGQSTGNAGNIDINTRTLSLTEGSEINSKTIAQGNSGNITVNAQESIFLDGSGSLDVNNGNSGVITRIINSVDRGAIGNAGKIELNTGTLEVNNQAFISSSVDGVGNGGDITINAGESVKFDNIGRVESSVFFNGIGNGGDIKVNTKKLSLTNGGSLLTTVGGQGNAGNIYINASDRTNLDGSATLQFGVNTLNIESNINSSLLLGGVGKGGNIEIVTGSFSGTNGIQLSTQSNGQGNAGNIKIEAKDSIIFDNVGTNGRSSRVETVATSNGNSGKIEFKTDSLILSNGALINSSILGEGKGNAGDIDIDAKNQVIIRGRDENRILNSQIRSTVNFTAEGNGGEIKVKTGSLLLDDSGLISTTTFGKGNAGKIFVDASEIISLSDSSEIASNTFSTDNGKGGEIKLNSDQFRLTNGSQISAISSGNADAGNIEINVNQDVIIQGGNSNQPTGILTNLAADSVGSGGEVKINSASLSLDNTGFISTATSGTGDAGKIFIDTSQSVSLSKSSLINSGIFPGGIGDGGEININTQKLTLTGGSQIDTTVVRQTDGLPGGQGKGGQINIDASESVTISGINSQGNASGIFTLTERGASGDAGDIQVNSDRLRITNTGTIAATTFNNGNAGKIIVNAGNLELVDGGQITTKTFNIGDAGTINLNVKYRITFSGSDTNFNNRLSLIQQQINSSDSTDTINDFLVGEGANSGLFASTSTESTGKGGSIFTTSQKLTLEDGARISVSSEGSGRAGILDIKAQSVRLNNQASLNANTRSSDINEEQATINLNSDFLILLRNSNITTNANGENVIGGNININSDIIAGLDNSDISANSTDFRGGRVIIDTQGLFGIRPRNAPTPNSDITATGANPNLTGSTEVTEPDTNPTQGIIELATNFEDRSNQIGQMCPNSAKTARNLSKFTVTGKGSLPPSPLKPLSGRRENQRLATLDGNPRNVVTRDDTSSETIIEAGAIASNSQGEIYLIASSPNSRKNLNFLLPCANMVK